MMYYQSYTYKFLLHMYYISLTLTCTHIAGQPLQYTKQERGPGQQLLLLQWMHTISLVRDVGQRVFTKIIAAISLHKR